MFTFLNFINSLAKTRRSIGILKMTGKVEINVLLSFRCDNVLGCVSKKENKGKKALYNDFNRPSWGIIHSKNNTSSVNKDNILVISENCSSHIQYEILYH